MSGVPGQVAQGTEEHCCWSWALVMSGKVFTPGITPLEKSKPHRSRL